MKKDLNYKNEFEDGWPGGEGVCGKGSLPEVAHISGERFKSICRDWAKKNGRPPRITEIGCGDMVWHGKTIPTNLGYQAIDLHRRDTWERWERRGVEFVEGEASRLYIQESDIAIARAVFIHLSNDAISAVLQNLREYGVPILVAESFAETSNEDRFQGDGDFFRLGSPCDLTADPFNLELIEGPKGGHPRMMVFSLSSDN